MNRKVKKVPGSRQFKPQYNYRGFGRPCEYSSEILDKTIEYMNECERCYEIPYLQELSLILGIDDETLLEWAKKKDAEGKIMFPDFSATIKMLKKQQELKLLRSSMYAFSSTGSLFQLKTNHGYVETEKRVIEAKVQNEDMKTLADIANAKLEQMRGQTSGDK